MIVYKITNRRNECTYAATDSESVYYILIKMGVDEETAIDASSWTEIAVVEETYMHTGFVLSIIEE